MTDPKDRLFQDPERHLVDFAFDESVVAVFPDMIRRSVPGYETVIPLTGLMAAGHVTGRRTQGAGHSESTPIVYDLGCSLGATTLAALRQLGQHTARLIAVDSSAPMVDEASRLITDPRVEFLLSDVRALEFEPASVIILNYVLQFIPPEDRLQLLGRIRAALAPDGLLLVSGKIRFEDPEEQAFHEAMHLDFKRANGYRELEINGKRNALERVMIVDTEEEHQRLFLTAGFSKVRKWYQCLNWVSYAIEP